MQEGPELHPFGDSERPPLSPLSSVSSAKDLAMNPFEDDVSEELEALQPDNPADAANLDDSSSISSIGRDEKEVFVDGALNQAALGRILLKCRMLKEKTKELKEVRRSQKRKLEELDEEVQLKDAEVQKWKSTNEAAQSELKQKEKLLVAYRKRERLEGGDVEGDNGNGAAPNAGASASRQGEGNNTTDGRGKGKGPSKFVGEDDFIDLTDDAAPLPKPSNSSGYDFNASQTQKKGNSAGSPGDEVQVIQSLRTVGCVRLAVYRLLPGMKLEKFLKVEVIRDRRHKNRPFSLAIQLPQPGLGSPIAELSSEGYGVGVQMTSRGWDKLPALVNEINQDYYVDIVIKVEDSEAESVFKNLKMMKSPLVWNFGMNGAQETYNTGKSSIVHQEELTKKLNKLFEGMSRLDGESANVDAMIRTELFKHQRQALYWMLSMETDMHLPAFYENNGRNYHNIISDEYSTTRPRGLCGGIVADDMGMGKTIQMLSLVATNRPDMGATAGDAPSGKIAGGTLVVCPVSVMSNWQDQISTHIPGNELSVYTYHGGSRIREAEKLAQYDVVITTYSCLGMEVTNEKGRKGKNAAGSSAAAEGPDREALMQVHWHRVVLDEAHCIKMTRTRQARAALKLSARFRWALTGTPLQNHVDDLFSLVAFLRVEPFSNRHWWQDNIVQPLMSGDERGTQKLQLLMRSICIRRTKTMEVDGKKLVELPPKTVRIQRIEMSRKEKALYQEAFLRSSRIFQKMDRSGSVLKNYSTILELILRLRQLCDHSYLYETSMQKSDMNDATILDDVVENTECSLCQRPFTEPQVTPCLHVFCNDCLQAELGDSGKGPCPTCNEALVISRVKAYVKRNASPVNGAEKSLANVENSTKVIALLGILGNLRATDPSQKTVVFSQFTSMLDLLHHPLEREHHVVCRLDGKMSAQARADTMRRFASAEPGSPSVMLCSLRVAGFGLNLVSASNVIIIDPWWNPFVEEQAMDRVHRLGQKREVQVFRLVAERSIEEKMVELQEKKRGLADAALENQSREQLQKLRLADLKAIFSVQNIAGWEDEGQGVSNAGGQKDANGAAGLVGNSVLMQNATDDVTASG